MLQNKLSGKKFITIFRRSLITSPLKLALRLTKLELYDEISPGRGNARLAGGPGFPSAWYEIYVEGEEEKRGTENGKIQCEGTAAMTLEYYSCKYETSGRLERQVSSRAGNP